MYNVSQTGASLSGKTAASYTTMPQGTLFLIFVLALLPNVMSTDEAVVVSCCSTGNYSNIVLKHAQSMNGTIIAIHIQPGKYTLPGSYQFQNKSEISIANWIG